MHAKHVGTGIATIVLTDELGRFSISSLRKGKYLVSVEKKGYRPVNSEWTVDGLVNDTENHD